jgi:hypothetical protein
MLSGSDDGLGGGLSSPVSSGERCRGIHPSIRPSLSPGYYAAGRPAVSRGLFARGGGRLYHRALGGNSPLCLCRQMRGPGSGRLAAGSIKPPELDELSDFARAFWGNAVSSSAEQKWRPLDWPVGCSPDPCASVDTSTFPPFPRRCPASAVARQPRTTLPDGP